MKLVSLELVEHKLNLVIYVWSSLFGQMRIRDQLLDHEPLILFHLNFSFCAKSFSFSSSKWPLSLLFSSLTTTIGTC